MSPFHLWLLHVLYNWSFMNDQFSIAWFVATEYMFMVTADGLLAEMNIGAD